jgi:hypothetical protein
MSTAAVHACECTRCRAHRLHPERALHHHINLLVSRLNEQQRRWFVALEAERRGYGGTEQVAAITGLSPHTIRKGRRELTRGFAGCPTDRLRAPGGGRPAREVQDPALVPTLERVLAEETAGDPMGRRPMAKRSSLAHLSAVLGAAHHPASRPTVSRLIRALGYSPKLNARRTEARTSPPDRDAQFQHIARLRKEFPAAGQPIVSVDTKKKKGVDR